MRLTWSVLCLVAIVLTVDGGRSGGGGRSSSGGSRSSGSRSSGGWGSSSSSSRSSGSHSSGSSWSSKPTSHNTGYGGSSWSSGGSSGRVTKPQSPPTHFSNSHLIPVSTGSRTPNKPSGGKVNEHVQQAHVTNQHSSSGASPHSPSAPPLPSGSNAHVPSAPPLPGNHPPGHQPPGPGWKPGVVHDVSQKQNINNLNNQQPGSPPPYPGAPGHYPNQAPPPYPGTSGHYPNQPPPPYSGAGHYPNQPPPPYSGAGHYPNQPPPPYSGVNHPYPNHPPPAYSGGSQHYPVQQGGPVYYPPPPPAPPGYTPYGVPYYKDKSGIRGSDVIAGLALWEVMRSRNHHNHGYGIQQVHHHHYENGNNNYRDGGSNYDSTSYYQPTYHDTMRERYTTRTSPSRQTTGPGAYNILEMTHYITADDKGVISSSEGNMTCISVYNAKSVSGWHQRQVNDFNKLYPNSTFPLYRLENDTQSENFTVVPGRIVHREPVSITCCGTDKGILDLNLLTNGKHPNVNCVNQLGHIPIKKLTFVRTQAQTLPVVNTTGWHEINLLDPNATTPVPLAAFPTTAPSNSSTTDNLQIYTSTVRTILLSDVTNLTVTSFTNQTFAPIEEKNGTETVDMTQVFDSLKSNSTSNITEGVTDNPDSLIVW